MSTSEKPGDSSARGHLTEEGPPPRTGEGFPAGGGSYQDLDDGEKTVPLAYVVEWRDSKHSGTYAIDSADDLRRRIRPAPGKSAGDRKLVIVRGLPDTLLDILQDELHVDREFIQAHVARRRYRPPVWMCPAQYAQYEYPELVTRRDATQQDVARRSHQGRDVRGARESVVHPDIRTFSTDGEAVVFCQASHWKAGGTEVLLLDWPLWIESASPFQKAQYVDPRTRSSARYNEGRPVEGLDTGQCIGGETPSFVDRLLDGFKASPYYSQISHFITASVFNHWLDFFEALDDPPRLRAVDYSLLCWRVAQSLERNRFRNRAIPEADVGGDRNHRNAEGDDWEALLGRLSRRIELQQHLSQSSTSAATVAKAEAVRVAPGRDVLAFNSASAVADDGRQNLSGWHSANSHTQNEPRPLGRLFGHKTATERALEFLNYVAAVLVPISSISAILSMSEPFNPTGRYFWTFWVVVLPIIAVALVLTYLSTIFKDTAYLEDEETSKAGPAGGRQKDRLDAGAGAELGKEAEQRPVLPAQPKDKQEPMGVHRFRRGRGPRATAGRMFRPAAISSAGDYVVDLGEQEVAAAYGEEGEAQPQALPPLPSAAGPVAVEEQAEHEVTEEEEGEGVGALPDVIVERRADGTQVTYRRRELGWAGAAMVLFRVWKPRQRHLGRGAGQVHTILDDLPAFERRFGWGARRHKSDTGAGKA